MRLALCLLFFVSANCWAHRSHFGWTDITQNGQLLEVVHRVHEHDAALLVAQITGAPADITSLEIQARFALYIANHFSLRISSPDINSADISAKATELQLVGAELKGKYVLVYQELKLSHPAGQLELDTDILMELYGDQIHLINLDIPGIKQTLEFNQTTTTQTVTHASSY